MVQHYRNTLLQSERMSYPLVATNFFVQNRWIIVIGYGVLLSILVLRIRYTKQTLGPVVRVANQQLDYLRYEISKILYQQKDTIHDFQNTIPLLLHYKNECLIHLNNPRDSIEQIYEESNYIFTLVNQTNPIEKDKLFFHKRFILKLYSTLNHLKGRMSLLTLGISRIILG